MENCFKRLLKQYPGAAQGLRQLSVEVTNFSRGEKCGWKVIERYAEQLEELEVIVYDDLWCDGVTDQYEDSTLKNSAYNLENDKIAEVYPGIDSETMDFTNLTHLTLAVTARILDHLLNFAHGLPALIELRLGCHFRPDAEFDDVSPDLFANSMEDSGAEFSSLERLSIGGSDQTASDVLETLLEYTPRLAHITLGISKSRTIREMMRLLKIVSECKTLRGFAFYGAFVSKMVRCWAGNHGDGHPIRGFDGLEVLALEAIRETYFQYVSEILNSVSPAFPDFQSSGLLSNTRLIILSHSDRPVLPSITRISWMDSDERTPFSAFSPTSRQDRQTKRKSDGRHPFTRHAEEQQVGIDDLFNHYPSLSRLEWIEKYPSNPFDDDLHVPGRKIMHSVDRPSTSKDDVILGELLIRG